MGRLSRRKQLSQSRVALTYRCVHGRMQWSWSLSWRTGRVNPATSRPSEPCPSGRVIRVLPPVRVNRSWAGIRSLWSWLGRPTWRARLGGAGEVRRGRAHERPSAVLFARGGRVYPACRWTGSSGRLTCSSSLSRETDSCSKTDQN